MNDQRRADAAMYQRTLDMVRSARLRTLAMVVDLSRHDFDLRSNPWKWSIGEVLDHLLLFDRFLAQVIAHRMWPPEDDVLHDASRLNSNRALA